MKKSLLIWLFAFVAISFMATNSSARNSMLADLNDTCNTSYSCGFCHIDPGGGGPLTQAGSDYLSGGACAICPDATTCSGGACATYTDRKVCNATPGCTYDNGAKACIDDPNACVPFGLEICTGGIDEDCDGAVDCADSECIGNPACTSTGACIDHIDKTSCNADATCEWSNRNKVCNDKACTPSGPEICTGGIDEDCNGLIDCEDTASCSADPACTSGGPENCKDGIDNDKDGSTDCADSDCATDDSCVNAINSSHRGINQYNGPQTCLGCHGTAMGNDVLNSVHGSWLGDTPNVTNINGSTGKWGQTNNYCTDPEMADYACLKCHVSLVAPVVRGVVDMSATNLTAADMDCMQCHQANYAATFMPDPATATIYTSCVDGSEHTYVVPTPEADGKIHKVIRLDLLPGETEVSLARTVHRPNNTTCLMPCHAAAGGGDGTKRGDLSSDMIDPSVSMDVHLSSAGNAKLTCTGCHTATNHQIPGRGNDLRPEDTGATMTQCVDCHTNYDAGAHGTSTSNRQAANRHVAKVACTSCHIDVYGKGVGTEVSRDWTVPHWNAGGCEGQGAYVGHEVRGTNLTPEYRFWDGTSWVYDRDGNAGLMTDPIDGGLTMSYPNGDINNGKLYPFKIHTSVNPVDDNSGKTNFDVLQMFMTGCYDNAAIDGLSYIGETGSYTWTANKAFQLITHGVAPKTTANNCSKCHSTEMNTSTDSKLDKLGYKTPKPTSDLCNDCHGFESSTNYFEVHDLHRNRGIGCSRCHSFSRP